MGRLQEFFGSTLQGEVNNLFNSRISLHSMRVSMYVHQRFLVTNMEAQKYRSAVFMELFTGVPPVVHATKVDRGDPTHEMISEEESFRIGKLRGKTSVGGKLTAGLPEVERTMLAKGIASGLEVTSLMHEKELIYSFLEKLREFYLVTRVPDLNEWAGDQRKINLGSIGGNGGNSGDSSSDGSENPTPNLIDAYLPLMNQSIHRNYYFKPKVSMEKYDGRCLAIDELQDIDWQRLDSLDKLPPRQSVYLMPTFAIPARALISFPDVERFLDPFSDILINDAGKLRFLIKPVFTVEPLKESEALIKWEKVGMAENGKVAKSNNTSDSNSLPWNPIAAVEYCSRFMFSPFLIRPNLFADDETNAPRYIFEDRDDVVPFTKEEIANLSMQERMARTCPEKAGRDSANKKEYDHEEETQRKALLKKAVKLNEFGYVEDRFNHYNFWRRKMKLGYKLAPVPWSQLQKPTSK